MKQLEDVIIAHRGESYDAPENTLAAINLAWNRNVKAVEIDIHLTSDNEIVVFHDYNTKRLTGASYTIAKTPISSLKHLEVVSPKKTQSKGEKIPTLSEVLQTIPMNCRLIIEIKSSSKILLPLSNILRTCGLSNNQIEIICFNYGLLKKAKKLMPQYTMLLLLNLDYSLRGRLVTMNKKRIINRAKKANLNGVNVWAGKLLNSNFINSFHSEELLVYCWTVNDVNHARSLLNYNIDGITTDRAQWIISNLRNS